MIQRLNEESGRQETLHLAHVANASKADHTWATALTTDQCLHS